jgi:hypothetical protein
MPRDEESSASTVPRPSEADLAAFRQRLDATLAARRSGSRAPMTGAPVLGGATRPGPSPPNGRRVHRTAGLLLLSIVVLVAAGIATWPLLPDRPDLVESRRALSEERARSQKLADELMATWRDAKAQAMALAESESRERQVQLLRQALREAEEVAIARDHFLAHADARIRQLEEKLAASAPVPATPAPSVAPAAIPVTETAPVPDSELPRLVARAHRLLGQGDIGAARIVLERAAESGNALVLFALAETFDPAALARWGTLGTQGDPARAQALYERAYAGGVHAAADRLAALQ